VPPAIPSASERPDAAIGSGVLQDRLLVTPTRVVATIGNEVVVLAGICGPEGCFVTRQPVEWSLSRDSVGSFVDYGEAGHKLAACILHTSSRDLTNDFVTTRTSTSPRVITRGTPTLGDDVWLKKGQSWVSVTSASEGISYVSVVAPGAENWEQRRQTATIHWIDAQWSIPAPAIARAGRPHALTTTVTRSSDGQPAAGWIIRYRVAEGAAAAFGRDSETSTEVRTDAQGRASAQLDPLTKGPGVTQVQIEIVSPNGGSTAGHVLWKGFTSVTWSAPGLDVQVSGPDHIAVDTAATYRIEVSNPGDLAARNVLVSAVIPPFLKFLTSNPTAERFEPRVEWRLGDLSPRETRVLELQCRAVREGNVRLPVEATGDGGLKAAGFANTRTSMPALDVRFEQSPTEAKVGELVLFSVVVRNVGSVRLTNVEVRDRFDPGLEHRYGWTSPILRTLGDLEPNAVSSFDVSFFVRTPGRLCHTLDATSAEGHSASARACLDVSQPKQDVDLQLTGPEQRRVGQLAEYAIRATNTGETSLTNVRIGFYAEPSLLPRHATDGHAYQEGGVIWQLGAIEPGQEVSLIVQCECLRADDRAEARLTFHSEQQITRTATVPMEILPPAARPDPTTKPPPERVVPSPPLSASGRLELSIADVVENVRVGEIVTYLVTIKNHRVVPDRNVNVAFVLTDGIEFVDFDASGLDIGTQVSSNRRRVTLETIRELRPNEQLKPLRIRVRATKPGVAHFRTEVTSVRSPEPVVEDADTTVLAP